LWYGEDNCQFYGLILNSKQTFLVMVKFATLISISLLFERLDRREFIQSAESEIFNFLIRAIVFYINFSNVGTQISIFRVEGLIQSLGERFLVRMSEDLV